ncbi:MAG: DUF3772 domain-containing protein [Pseudolabrys sp.]
MSYNTFKGHGPSLLSHSAKLLRLLFVLAMIVGIILCATELFFRVIDFADLRPDSAERALNGGDAVQLDSELGWVQIPNIVTQAYTGNRTISVKHNSLGLRENELLEDAPNGTFIFLGDSMVWGLDSEINERFTDLLQQELPQHRIVNAGVLGYGTDQELLLLQRLWAHVKPKVVILTFSVDNDRGDNSTSLRYGTNYKPNFIRTSEYEWRVRGYPLPRLKREYITGNIWVENFLLARFAVLTYRALRYRETIVSDPTDHLIDMIRRTAEARGAQFVVGLQRHEAKLEAYLDAQKIPHTAFDEAQRYPTAGGHWTPEGNKIVAKRYLSLFSEAGVLPGSLIQSGEPAVLNRNGIVLDQIEAALDHDDVSAEMMTDYSNAITPVRDALHAMVAELEARSDSTETILKSARAGAQRADQVASRVAVLRHVFFGRSLFERSQSVVSPYVWLETTRVLPRGIKKLYGMLQFWSIEMKDSGGLWRGTMALLVLTVLHTASKFLWTWWRQHITVVNGSDHVLAKALASFGTFFCIATAIPIAAIAVGESFEVRIFEVTYGIYAGVIVAAFGEAVAVGVLAPDAPWRRLIAIDDKMARVLARGLSWGTKVLGLLQILVAANNAIAAPPSMQLATIMLFSLVIAGLLLHLLVWTHRNQSYSATNWVNVTTAWLSILGWLALVVIAIALIAGYARFAAFVAQQMVSSVAVLGALYLLFVLARALFVKAPLGQIVAANFGVSQRWLVLVKGITASGICLSLTLTVLVSIVSLQYIIL